MCRLKHVESSVNFGINSITKLHFVGISTESYYDARIHEYETLHLSAFPSPTLYLLTSVFCWANKFGTQQPEANLSGSGSVIRQVTAIFFNFFFLTGTLNCTYFMTPHGGKVVYGLNWAPHHHLARCPLRQYFCRRATGFTCTHSRGSWVGRRASLDTGEEKMITAGDRNETPTGFIQFIYTDCWLTYPV